MRRTAVVLVVGAVLTLTGFIIANTAQSDQPAVMALEPPATPHYFDEVTDPTFTGYPEVSHTPVPTTTPTPTPDPWTDEEVEAIARTLSGECYDDKPTDKRLVAEVILNRVSDGYWGCTVLEVVTAKSQFHGYWNPSRDISDSDREIAIQALTDWYANNCNALSDYLFFEAGPNRENVFRSTY